jgi:hypothetical protein
MENILDIPEVDLNTIVRDEKLSSEKRIIMYKNIITEGQNGSCRPTL